LINIHRILKYILYSLAIISLFTGCSESTQKNVGEFQYQPVNIKYATGFTIDKAESFYRVTVLTPYKDATQPLTYIFYDRLQNKPAVEADAYIPIPIKSIVCTSTTHIPLLEYLGEANSLIGFPTLNYISSAAMRQRIDDGKIKELGVDEALNIENLVSIKPEMVMGYSMSSDFGQFGLIEEAGIPVVLNAEYLERHPLGRAEWIKLAGVLFDKEAMADSVFSSIESQYIEARDLATNSASRPTVMSGIVYGDSWYVPGGKNYAAKILQDAGFKYIWEHDTTNAFLPLSFETVYDNASNAYFWIGVGSFKSLAELSASDSRYETFNPFKNHNIYSYNKRIGAEGGSEFLELGYLRPDLILRDLVHIGHPNLLPDHELFFHFRLP
jgi:cobalamin transport system substrate-binding protein